MYQIKARNHPAPHLFQSSPHYRNIKLRLVISETVPEDEPYVILAFGGRPVILLGQSLANRPKIHRLLDDCVVIRDPELDRVDGLLERPGELVRPDCRHHFPFDVKQLVGHPARPVRGRLGGRLDLKMSNYFTFRGRDKHHLAPHHPDRSCWDPGRGRHNGRQSYCKRWWRTRSYNG